MGTVGKNPLPTLQNSHSFAGTFRQTDWFRFVNRFSKR